MGASVRAAAMSAIRAGLTPICADRFGDVDLGRRAEAVRVDDYPSGLAAALAGQAVDGWIYTGAIENHPEFVEKMAATHVLYGVDGPGLRAVRDPLRLADVLASRAIPRPEAVSTSNGLPMDGSWLRKPLRGAGGAGISAWRGAASHETPSARLVATENPERSHYFQERIAGRPCSAVFVGAGGRATLLGFTWQLVGTQWTGAGEFAYAGSVGPIELSISLRGQLDRLGDVLAQHFPLAGLFGVDAMLSDDVVWPVEVNPRYTASVEVLERGLEIAAIGLHLDACRGQQLPSEKPRKPACCCGKAILYARRDVAVPPAFSKFAESAMSNWPWPDWADVPAAGSTIRARAPVVTVLAEGADEASVLDRLQTRIIEAERLLY